MTTKGRSAIVLLLVGLMVAGALHLAPSLLASESDEDPAIANSLATMLRAARQVISSSQERINDPNLGDKGLTGRVVLERAIEVYRKAGGTDPQTLDPASRHGRLLHAQMDAITEVMDTNQAMINAKGVAFKAFIPAVFARLVNEAFEARAKTEAQVKVTAPEELVRNRKARPDHWEKNVIQEKLLAAEWPRSQSYAAIAESNGRPAFRMMIPEYYVASCLSCHGSPKGDMDITGYPKEGGKEGDLGAVISVTLFK
jgi:Protein of unknown function (DUF3365)